MSATEGGADAKAAVPSEPLGGLGRARPEAWWGWGEGCEKT